MKAARNWRFAIAFTLASFLAAPASNAQSVESNDFGDCDVVLDFFWLSTKTIKALAGIGHPNFQSEFQKNRQLAQESVMFLNDRARSDYGNTVRFCFGDFKPLGIEFLATVPGMKVDMNLWNKVLQYAKSGSVPAALRIQAGNDADRLCLTGFDLMSNVADALAPLQSHIGGGDVPPPPMPLPLYRSIEPKENPIRVIYSECALTDFAPFTTRATTLVYATSPWDFVEKVGDRVLEKFLGRLIADESDVVPARRLYPSFLQSRRKGVYVKSLDALMLAHEVGHYMGLTHMGSGESYTPLDCFDSDDLESGVRDTPPGPGTYDDKEIKGVSARDYLKLPRSKWPKSCKSVIDVTGKTDDRMSMDNLMNSGSADEYKRLFRFTEGQKATMKRMSAVLTK